MNPTLKQTLVSSKETRAYQLSAGHYIKSTIHWTMMQTNQTLLWDQGKVLICHSNILEEPAFDATEKQKLGWRHWVSLPKTKYQLTLPRWFIWFLRRDTSDGRRGFNRNSSAPSSKHLSKKKKKKIKNPYKFQHKRHFVVFSTPEFQWQIYLLILVGMFSEDMTTTGISLRVDDSCQNYQIERNLKN